MCRSGLGVVEGRRKGDRAKRREGTLIEINCDSARVNSLRAIWTTTRMLLFVRARGCNLAWTKRT